MLALGQKASQGADQCARACSRGAAVSRKPPGGGGKGRAHKHAGGKKHHHQTVKHHPGHHKKHSHHGGGPAPPVVVKGHHHHHARGWSPGTDVACCAAEALGTLLGWSPADVLEVYWLTAGDPDSGASILSTLEASGNLAGGGGGGHGAFDGFGPGAAGYGEIAHELAPGHVVHGLILGVSLPEPHAVAVTPDGTWWSWGEHFDPCCWPQLAVEEAWPLCL